MEGGRGRVAQSLQLAVRLIPAEEGSGQEISSDSQVEKSWLKCALLLDSSNNECLTTKKLPESLKQL